MKNIFLLIPLFASCSMLGGGKDDQVSIPKQPKREQGEYLPGPCSFKKADGSEKSCNAPGVCCLSDSSCHSIKDKCLK